MSSIYENGEMIIYPPPDGDYSFCITSSSDGNMTYTIKEYCTQLGQVTRLFNYYDIPIKQNSTFLGSKEIANWKEFGVITVGGNRVRCILLYEPNNMVMLNAYIGGIVHFRYGGEAGVRVR